MSLDECCDVMICLCVSVCSGHGGCVYRGASVLQQSGRHRQPEGPEEAQSLSFQEGNRDLQLLLFQHHTGRQAQQTGEIRCSEIWATWAESLLQRPGSDSGCGPSPCVSLLSCLLSQLPLYLLHLIAERSYIHSRHGLYRLRSRSAYFHFGITEKKWQISNLRSWKFTFGHKTDEARKMLKAETCCCNWMRTTRPACRVNKHRKTYLCCESAV